VVISGDVHHAYLAEVAFRREAGVESAVYQATCSPFRNPLNKREETTVRFATSWGGHIVGRSLAKSAGVRDPDLRWRFVHGPWFDNQVATLDLHDREAHITIERTVADEWREPKLHACLERRLS
jgi:hypothetical protein